MSLKDLLSAALDENMNEFEAAFDAAVNDRIQIAIEDKYDNMFGMEDFVLSEEQAEELIEKLIVFGGGAKYGQIVFLAGGAGSGKGFASGAFMESDKFKVRDVDEWKKAFLKISELKKKYPEIRGLNLKNSEDVYALHMFVKKLGLKDKTLDLLLKDARADRLPNIMFDITAKDMSDITDVLPILKEAGYNPRNIHLAWILTDYRVSYAANLTRSRVVPADVFLDTHKGASKTMQKVLDSGKLPSGMDGRFVVVLNNRENTIYFEPGEKYKGKTIPETAKGVRDFYYIAVKDPGKPFKSEDKWKTELHNQIVNNVPGGQSTIDNLRKDALERLGAKAEEGDEDAKEGVRLVNRDIELEKKRK